MNTADRSLTMLDTALRRRFEFREMYPRMDLLEDIRITIDGRSYILIRRMVECMNERLKLLYDSEHLIGHAYFTGLRELAAPERFRQLGRIMHNQIIPLLEEYFSDDMEKIAVVLVDNHEKTHITSLSQESTSLLMNIKRYWETTLAA